MLKFNKAHLNILKVFQQYNVKEGGVLLRQHLTFGLDMTILDENSYIKAFEELSEYGYFQNGKGNMPLLTKKGFKVIYGNLNEL